MDDNPLKKVFKGDLSEAKSHYGIGKTFHFITKKIAEYLKLPYYERWAKVGDAEYKTSTIVNNLDEIIVTFQPPEPPILEELERIREVDYIGVMIMHKRNESKIFFKCVNPKYNFYIDVSGVNGGEAYQRWVPVIATLNYNCKIGIFAYRVNPYPNTTFGIYRIVKFRIRGFGGNKVIFGGDTYQQRDFEYKVDHTIKIHGPDYGYVWGYGYEIENVSDREIADFRAYSNNSNYWLKHGVVWFDGKGKDFWDKIKYNIYASTRIDYHARFLPNQYWTHCFRVYEWHYNDGSDMIYGMKLAYDPKGHWRAIISNDTGGTPNNIFPLYKADIEKWGDLRDRRWTADGWERGSSTYHDKFHYEFLVGIPNCIPLLNNNGIGVAGYLFLYHTVEANYTNGVGYGQTAIDRTRVHWVWGRTDEEVLEDPNVHEQYKSKYLITFEQPWMVLENNWKPHLGTVYGEKNGLGGGTLLRASVVDNERIWHGLDYQQLMLSNMGRRGGIYFIDQGAKIYGKGDTYPETGAYTKLPNAKHPYEKELTEKGGREIVDRPYGKSLRNLFPAVCIFQSMPTINTSTYFDLPPPGTLIHHIYVKGMDFKKKKSIESVITKDVSSGDGLNYDRTCFFAMMPITGKLAD